MTLARIDRRWFVTIALVALVWSVFGQTLRHEFINYDDPIYVYSNPRVTAGLSVAGIGWAFTHIHAQNWHPITTLSHMLDCDIYGVAPWGHHLTNVLLHTAAVLLLLHTLLAITGRLWRSAFVAAVFAIHPLRVESVAWIAERKDVLSGVCFMLTLLLYQRYVRQPGIVRYLLVFVACACGMMAKPMLVTLPFVLLLLDYWPLLRFERPRSGGRKASTSRIIVEKVPLLLLSAGAAVATLLAQGQYVGSGEELSLPDRLTNAVLSYVAYVRQTFWPAGLVPFYPHRQNAVPAAGVVMAIGLLAVITALAIVWRRKRPYVFVGWFWYLGMLVPVIGIVQVGWQARADRYTYLPAIGLYIALTWTIGDVVKNRRRWQRVTAAAAVISIAGFAAAAFAQTSYWRNSERLWSHTLAVTPENDVALNNLGIVLLAQGRSAEALQRFEAALRLRPGNVPAHTNMANILLARGDTSSAVMHLRDALALEPGDRDAGDLMGVVLLRQGDVRAAVEQWTRTLIAQPDDGNALSNLAWVYATSPDATIRDGAKAVELAAKAFQFSGRKNALVLRTLAAAYAEAGRFDEANAAARAALSLAREQNNAGLVAELQATIRLYEQRLPLRDNSLAQRTAN